MARTLRHTAKAEVTDEQKEQWSADRAERVKHAQELLAQGVSNLQTNEGWIAMLTRMARIGRLSPARLSFGNQMLVEAQCPGAVYVATYKTWMKYGRKVMPKKDWPFGRTHSISILRPVVRRGAPSTVVSNEEAFDELIKTPAKPRVFFTTMALFDVDLTDGEPLPDPYAEMPSIEEQEGFEHSAERVADLLVALPDRVVSAVQFVTKHPTRKGVDGWYERDTRAIKIVTKGRNRATQFATLIHEAGHAILHGGEDHHSRAEREVEAESVAFVVCHALGLDVAKASFSYVALWGGKTSDDKDAVKQVMQSGQRISKAANMILDAIMGDEKEPEGEDE